MKVKSQNESEVFDVLGSVSGDGDRHYFLTCKYTQIAIT